LLYVPSASFIVEVSLVEDVFGGGSKLLPDLPVETARMTQWAGMLASFGKTSDILLEALNMYGLSPPPASSPVAGVKVEDPGLLPSPPSPTQMHNNTETHDDKKELAPTVVSHGSQPVEVNEDEAKDVRG
jgi:hypothetical protein